MKLYFYRVINRDRKRSKLSKTEIMFHSISEESVRNKFKKVLTSFLCCDIFITAQETRRIKQ